jgi:hypothetical protein
MLTGNSGNGTTTILPVQQSIASSGMSAKSLRPSLHSYPLNALYVTPNHESSIADRQKAKSSGTSTWWRLQVSMAVKSQCRAQRREEVLRRRIMWI